MSPTPGQAPNWGGKRPGAGRSPRGIALRNISVSLPETLIEALDRQADLQRTSRSAILEHYLIQGLHSEPTYPPHPTQETQVNDGARKKTLKRR